MYYYYFAQTLGYDVWWKVSIYPSLCLSTIHSPPIKSLSYSSSLFPLLFLSRNILLQFRSSNSFWTWSEYRVGGTTISTWTCNVLGILLPSSLPTLYSVPSWSSSWTSTVKRTKTPHGRTPDNNKSASNTKKEEAEAEEQQPQSKNKTIKNQ